MVSVNGQAYTYDANGNLTGNGEKTYIYDIDNRLKEVRNNQGQIIASFTYDHEGKRNSMTASGTTTHFHYSGDKVVYETDNSNNIVAEYTYDPNGNPATMTRGGATYYYHVNGHGDVTALTDAAGNIVARYDYDAYGNILSQTGTMAALNPYRYAGYRYDEATGLYYLMARYYDANIGRFITRDSFHGFAGDPLSLNQYNYCGGNPVMYIDPTGHFRITWLNSVKWVARIIDAAIIILVAGAAINSTQAAKLFLKKNKNKVLYTIGGKISTMFPSVNSIAISAAINVALTLAGTSIGELIAKGLDFIDHWWGKPRNNGYIFG